MAGGVVANMGKVSLKYKCLLRRHKSVISRTACFVFVFSFLSMHLYFWGVH